MTVNPNAVDLLFAARNLIAKPESWTRGAAARKPDGAPVHPTHGAAVSYCASGAIAAVACRNPATYDGNVIADAHQLLAQALPDAPDLIADNGMYGAVSSYNDAPGRSHADIVAMFNRALGS